MACNSLFKEPDLLAYLNISWATLNRWIAEEHFPKGIKLGSGTRGAVRCVKQLSILGSNRVSKK